MANVKLNRQLTLEQRDQQPDGAGGFSETWVALGSLWAQVQARTGREAAGEAARLSTTGYRITVRAAPHGTPSRPKPGQRFRDDARRFRIEAVAEQDVNMRYLICFCEEDVVL
jgi:SPP1 family predicted phage head-tail adaptor